MQRHSLWELVHALWDGTFWQRASAVTDTHETYDLVMGDGLSWLAAAYFSIDTAS